MFRGCQLLMKIVSPRRSKGQHNNSNGTPGPFTNGRRGIARERKISRVTIQRRRELIGTRGNADHERSLTRAIFRHSSEFRDFSKNIVRRGKDEQRDEILNDDFSLLPVNCASKGGTYDVLPYVVLFHPAALCRRNICLRKNNYGFAFTASRWN